jgi:hypothetical protein
MKTKMMALCALAALGTVNSIQSANALPLLAENAAQDGGPLTAYPDHEDKNLVYFAPNSSGVAKSDETGLPRFHLINVNHPKGTDPKVYGGTMSFTLRLKSSADQAKEIEKMKAKGFKVALLPVVSSTINIKNNGTGAVPLTSLFKELNYSTKAAGTMESEIGLNSELTYLGSKIFTAAIDTGTVYNLDYCYLVQGLGPNMDAKIYVNMKRVYDYFRTSWSTGSIFRRIEITAEVEKLIKEKTISVEINGGEAKDRDYIWALTDKIVSRIFVPEIKAGSANEGGGGGGFSISRYSLNYSHKVEQDSETWFFKGRENKRSEFCNNIGVEDVRTYKNQLVQYIDL